MRRPLGGIGVLILCCLLVGCGYKTNPRPAAATIPADIGAVDAHIYPDRVDLRWEIPQVNTDGSPLRDLAGFKVYRIDHRIGEECENCPDEKKVHVTVEMHSPAGAVVGDREVLYSDRTTVIGRAYIYAVSAYNTKGRESLPSPDITVVCDEPPPAPENLQIASSAPEVVIQWAAPPRSSGIQGYRIYRGDTSRLDEMKPVGATKAGETTFKDKDVEKDRTYSYAVRSIKMNREIPSESKATPPVTVRVSTSRWQPPENVNTIAGDRFIRVSWDPARMPGETVRYNVYRSEAGQMFERVNQEPLATSLFVDRNVTRGRAYRYAVTAFPEGKPEEESSRSASRALEYRP